MNEIVNESAEMSAQQKELARIGTILMDLGAGLKIDKNTSDEEIEKSNKMGAFGDVLTRFGTAFGPKNLNDVLKAARVTAEEAREFMEIAKKAKSTSIKVADPEPQDEPEDDFDEPSDDEIARQADRMARGK